MATIENERHNKIYRELHSAAVCSKHFNSHCFAFSVSEWRLGGRGLSLGAEFSETFQSFDFER